MDRYFYHGIGREINCDTLDLMLAIMEMGVLKTRASIGYSGDQYEHVCLYRKNDSHNYSESGDDVSTAYDGWIEHSFCFIVSSDIAASKTGCFHDIEGESDAKFTDLVDEWRSDGEIPLDRVVGIGLPLDQINELRWRPFSSVDEEFDNKLSDILMFSESMDWIIVNSDETRFTDKVDEGLNHSSNNKYL